MNIKQIGLIVLACILLVFIMSLPSSTIPFDDSVAPSWSQSGVFDYSPNWQQTSFKVASLDVPACISKSIDLTNIKKVGFIGGTEFGYTDVSLYVGGTLKYQVQLVGGDSQHNIFANANGEYSGLTQVKLCTQTNDIGKTFYVRSFVLNECDSDCSQVSETSSASDFSSSSESQSYTSSAKSTYEKVSGKSLTVWERARNTVTNFLNKLLGVF